MAYEIPQQLAYKEKIMFGLTFKQLFYLFIFAPLIALAFFKTSLHLAAKIMICTMLAALAIGFIYLNLDKHLKNWYSWYISKSINKTEKLEKFIPIEEIKDDFIITSNNKKLAALRVTPINFAIKPDESKEAIAASFQKFLNSLDFPIQIIMNTENLDLKDYFKEVESKIQENSKFQALFQDYKKHLESITGENNVMNRNFYLIIQEKTDINIQIQICQAKLSNIGLKNARLRNNELEKLIKNFFIAKPRIKEEVRNEILNKKEKE